MSAAIKFLLFFIVAGVMPILMGLLPMSFASLQRRHSHLIVVSGYLSCFALFELIGLPVLFFTPMGNFRLLVILDLAAEIIWIIAGLIRCARSGGVRSPGIVRAICPRRLRQAGQEAVEPLRDEVIFWVIFLALLGFQLVMSYRLASYDGDDAYYVAQSLQTWQTGTMYHYVPYTGVTTALDGRHAMAMMPMWIAMVAKLSGTHPTIVTHSMIPFVFLPLADVCLYFLMRALMYEKVNETRNRRMLPAFMVIMALLQIFGNVSIYTPETFLMLRTWQGKTVFAAVIVPTAFAALLLLAHRIADHASVRFPVILAFLINAAAGMCTSMAPFLAGGLLLLGGAFIAVAFRQKKAFLVMLPACIPNVIYAAILLRIMLPTLLS